VVKSSIPDEWEVYAKAQNNISEKERAKLMLSRETVEGLSVHDIHVFLCVRV